MQRDERIFFCVLCRYPASIGQGMFLWHERHHFGSGERLLADPGQIEGQGGNPDVEWPVGAPGADAVPGQDFKLHSEIRVLLPELRDRRWDHGMSRMRGSEHPNRRMPFTTKFFGHPADVIEGRQRPTSILEKTDAPWRRGQAAALPDKE